MSVTAMVSVNGQEYASFAALGEKNANVLKRLVDEGRVKKAAVGHCTYYEVASARRELDEFRTVPPGYVRVSDVAEELGLASATAREIVRERGVPYVIRSTDNKKGSYFAEERALREALDRIREDHDPVLEAKRRADRELKDLRTASGPSFAERHAEPAPAAPAPGMLERMTQSLELGREANKNVRAARNLIMTRLGKAPASFSDLVAEGGLSVTMGARTSGEVARDELMTEGKVVRLGDGKLGLVIARRRAEPPAAVGPTSPDELEEAALKESAAFAQMRQAVLKTREQVRALEKRVAELEAALGRQGT